MNSTRRSSSHDPTDERAVDQSSQSASGLTTGQARRDRDPRGTVEEDVINRSRPNRTPRRYEQPLEHDAGRAAPSDRKRRR